MVIKTASLVYELCPCGWLTEDEIVDYLKEFRDAGETCNVLWQLEDMTATEWKDEIEEDRSTEYVAFLVDNMLTGIGRITPRPKHIANGKVGFAIRPRERGKRYASIFLQMIRNLCNRMGLEEVTACVDERNERSLKAFRAAGWVETGRKYEWRPDPEPRTAVEMTPKME